MITPITVITYLVGHQNVKKLPVKTPEALVLLEPEMGFEPTTYALRVRCSTSELFWQLSKLYFTAIMLVMSRVADYKPRPSWHSACLTRASLNYGEH